MDALVTASRQLNWGSVSAASSVSERETEKEASTLNQNMQDVQELDSWALR